MPRAAVKTPAVKKAEKEPESAPAEETKDVKPKEKAARKKTDTDAEDKLYKAKLDNLAARGICAYYGSINSKDTATKMSNLVTIYALDTIDSIEKQEGTKDYNPFPADKFIKLKDKLAPAPKKAAVNKTGSATKTIVKPKKPAMLKLPDNDEPAEEKVEKVEKAEVTVEPADAKTKEASKTNIVSFSTDGKTYLSFMFNRSLNELFEMNIAKAANSDEFTKSVMVHTSFAKSYMLKHVVYTVNRLDGAVANMSDGKYADHLGNHISAAFSKKKTVADQFNNYMKSYFKIIGRYLGMKLWTGKRTINKQVMEELVRVLDEGYHDYVTEGNFLTLDSEEGDYGVAYGIYGLARAFVDTLCPPAVKTNKSGKSGKAKKAEPAAETETEEAPSEEPNEDEEPAAEESEDVEQEPEVEPEAEEQEQEPDPEPEEKPKRKTNKTSKSGKSKN